jgi:hypothetical protein
MSLEAITQALTESVSPHANASEANQQGNPVTEVSLGESTEGKEVEEVKEKEMMSPRLSAIIKRENMLIRRERELKSKEKEMEGKLEGKLSRDELMQALKDEFEDDPYEFMEKNGFSYDKLQNRILSGDEGRGMSKLEKKIAELESKLSEADKKKIEDEEEGSHKEFETKRAQALTFIENQLKGKEEYELLNHEGSFSDVYEVIQEYFEETGKMMAVDEAARLVEKHLEDEFKKRLEYKKVRSWAGNKSDSIEDPNQSSTADQSSPAEFKETKTITSDMLQASSSSKSDLELSEEERVQKAMRLMSGKN